MSQILLPFFLKALVQKHSCPCILNLLITPVHNFFDSRTTYKPLCETTVWTEPAWRDTIPTKAGTTILHSWLSSCCLFRGSNCSGLNPESQIPLNMSWQPDWRGSCQREKPKYRRSGSILNYVRLLESDSQGEEQPNAEELWDAQPC
jgi:hypothetical protein